MKTILIFTISALIIVGFVTKKEKVKIWTDQVKVDQAIAYEKDLRNPIEYFDMPVSLSKSSYSLLDQFKIAKPIVIQRKQTGLLPLYVHYYYSEPDSILRYVYHNWERGYGANFFDLGKIFKEESSKLKEYNKEYEAIKSDLVEQFGKPKTEDTKPQMTDGYLSRNTNWESDNYHADLSMVFAGDTYNIRATYYWK